VLLRNKSAPVECGQLYLADGLPGNKVKVPLIAERVFKNVQVLRGISAKEFLETMGFFTASTPFSCGTCHGYATGGSWESYANDTTHEKDDAQDDVDGVRA
jgi:hypothetical protein